MDLREYVKDQLKRGYDAYTLRNYLLGLGYSESDVDIAFDSAVKKPVNTKLLWIFSILIIVSIFSYVIYSVVNLDAHPTQEVPGQPGTIDPGDSNLGSSELASCYDGKQNCHANNKCERGIDCGGPCALCEWEVVVKSEPPEEKKQVALNFASCDDEILNGLEAGVDCGGACDACIIASTSLTNLEMVEKAKKIAQINPDRAALACEELTEGIRDNCLSDVAELTEVISYCKNIYSDTVRDACYIEFGIQGDTSGCDKITDSDLKKACNQLKLLD